MSGGDSVDLTTEIEWASRAVSREWPGVIDAEDLRQDVWVRLLKSPQYTDQLKSLELDQRRNSLRKIARQICSREVSDYAEFTGNIQYSTRHVRRLLEEGVLTDDIPHTEVGGHSHTEQADVKRGLEELTHRNPRYAEVIRERFMRSASTEHGQVVTRSIDALTRIMNRNFRFDENDYEYER